MMPHTKARLDRLDRLAHNLDSRYRLPFTNIWFGWDAILGLVPGIGDTAALAPAAYILLEAHNMGAPTGLKLRMAGYTGIDWLIGTVPIVGDVFDVGMRANRRNVALLRDHLERTGDSDQPRGPDNPRTRNGLTA